MKNSKKATMLLLPVLAGFIIGLTVFLLSVTDAETKKTSNFLGEKQFILMNAYQKVQQPLLFIDLAAKYSSEKAILQLAESGGFKEEPVCGSYLGYNLYNNKTDNCFPGKLDSNFAFFLNTILDSYLSNYKKSYLTKDNYQTALKKDGDTLNVLGIAKDFLVVPIFKSFPSTSSTESFNKGRKKDLDTIVIHYTAGRTIQSAMNVFTNPSAQVSAHYIVGTDGTVKQVVEDTDTAWHAGACTRDTCAAGYEMMNSRSVGIEIVNMGFACGNLKPDGSCPVGCIKARKICWAHNPSNSLNENYPGAKCELDTFRCWEPYSDIQYTAVVKLTADIARRNNIQVDREHIIGHEEIKYQKYDPGPLFSLDKFVEDVNRELLSPQVAYSTNQGSEEPTNQVSAAATYNIDDNKQGSQITDKELEDSGAASLGFYKVNPSFKVSLNYDLDDYDLLKVKTVDIINSCKDKEDTEQCIKDRLNSFNNADWQWSFDCENEEVKIFNDLVDFISSCAQSIDNDCLCEFKDYKKPIIEKHGLEGEYGLKLTKQPEGLSIELTKPSTITHVIKNTSINYFNNNQLSPLTFLMYSLKYDGDEKDGADLQFESIKWDDQEQLTLFKNRSDLVFVKDDDLSSFPSDVCKPLKKFYKICSTNKKFKFTSFNKDANKIEQLPVTYRFALYFEDLTPPPVVTGLTCSDTFDAENNITISWEASSAPDVKKYYIYYNDSSFTDVSKTSKLLTISNMGDLDIFNITVFVEKDQVPYYFAVTAVDFNDNEEKIVESKEGVSVDDLIPGPVQNIRLSKTSNPQYELKLEWQKPSSNIDGSDIKEEDNELSYSLYWEEVELSTLDIFPKVENLKTTSKIITNLDPLKTYYFAVIPRDEKINPDQNFLNNLDLKNNLYGFTQISSSAVTE